MRKLLVCLTIGLMMVFLTGRSNATIVENVKLYFKSGSLWSGTITFADDYASMIYTSGYLNGGMFGRNQYFDWTWWIGNGISVPYSVGMGGDHVDWLMSGLDILPSVSYSPSPCISNNCQDTLPYHYYIGLTWNSLESKKNNSITFLISNSYYSGINGYGLFHEGDILKRYTTTSSPGAPVPEPATMILFGAGLAGLAAARRRKKAC